SRSARRPWTVGRPLGPSHPRRSRQPSVLRPKRPLAAPTTAPLRALSSPARLIARNQLMLAVADQIRAAHTAKRLPQRGPVVGVVISEERLVQSAHLQSLWNAHFLTPVRNALQWILPGVVHRRGSRHGRRQKCLHLVGAKPVLLEPESQLEHVFV